MELVFKIVKQETASYLLSTVVMNLEYEQLKEHLPLIIASSKSKIDVNQIVAKIIDTKDPEKIQELLYQILKQKNEDSVFVQRLKQLQDQIIK